jgi:hypothetical protein
LTLNKNWSETHFFNLLILKILNYKTETINILEKTKPVVKFLNTQDNEKTKNKEDQNVIFNMLKNGDFRGGKTQEDII